MSLGRPVTLNTGYLRADFDDLLASKQFSYAEALTIRLKSGSVLAYTSAQKAFTVPPCDGSLALQTYVAGDVLVTGFKFKFSNGCEGQGGDPTTSIPVDEMTLTFYPDANDAAPSMIDNVPFLRAIRQRAFDGAVIERDRWYFDAPGKNAIGGIPLFYGLASSVDQVSRTQAVVKVKADPILLNIMMPRNLFQPNCQYTVYSGPCGAVKASFANHATCGSATTAAFIDWTGASAQFTNGEITMETGPAINQTRTILRADNTGLWLDYPLYNAPLTGDAFVAYPGCNRLDPLNNPSTSGCAFFGRQAAFRATPHVPGPVFGI